MITDQLAAIRAQAPKVPLTQVGDVLGIDAFLCAIAALKLDIQRKTAEAVLDAIFEEQLTNHGNFYLMRKSAVEELRKELTCL